MPKTLAQLAFEKIPNNKVSRMVSSTGKPTIAVQIGPGMFVNLPRNLVESILAHEKLSSRPRPRPASYTPLNEKIKNNAKRLEIRNPMKNNNIRMKYNRKLPRNSKEYKEILERYFTNMHETLRTNANVRVVNVLNVRIRPFPFNRKGIDEFLSTEEYKNHLKSYKNAVMKTPYIHATPNKRQKLINLFSKSKMNTKNKNIEKAFKIYYERNPRKGVFNN
jgi:hypothetical protein